MKSPPDSGRFIRAVPTIQFATPVVTFVQSFFALKLTLPIMRLLVVGVATIPFACTQAVGRVVVPAKFYLPELAFRFPDLLSCLSAFGGLGTAIAWVGRGTFDAL